MVELIRIIKGEGLVAFGTVPPVDPVGSRGARITETGGWLAGIRSTEEGLKRIVE
jgi:hypothetical protein